MSHAEAARRAWLRRQGRETAAQQTERLRFAEEQRKKGWIFVDGKGWLREDEVFGTR